jgi:hypothetical protein
LELFCRKNNNLARALLLFLMLLRLCDKKFRNEDTLKNHLRSTHNIYQKNLASLEIEPQDSSSTKKKSKKKFFFWRGGAFCVFFLHNELDGVFHDSPIAKQEAHQLIKNSYIDILAKGSGWHLVEDACATRSSGTKIL